MEGIKKIGVVLVVLLVAVKSMIAPILFVQYEFTKDFIIENYCINKDKPELHCDGKCYLAKQLKAAKERDGKAAQSEFLSYLFSFQIVFNNIELNVQDSAELLFSKLGEEPIFKNPFHSNTTFIEVFHPPQGLQV